MTSERLTYTVINSKSWFVFDTQFYNEANFFYNLGVEYDVKVSNQWGETRNWQPSPHYKEQK